jgi:hypothetical protein
VFNSGIAYGLIIEIPLGGQFTPISTLGDKDEWKKAQKKLTKKKISDIMKRINPNLNPFKTFKVYFPWKEPSLTTSFNHKVKIKLTKTIPKNNKYKLEVCKYKAAPIAIKNILEANKYGQGLGSTKWYGWNFFIL